MYLHFQSKAGIAVAAVLTAALAFYAFAQEHPGAAPRGPEPSKGVPPRATPADYQGHAQAGKVTIAAEFDGHSIADPQSVLSTEDFEVVEVGLYGPPGSRLTLSYTDFSLKVNGKKGLLAAQPYELVFKSLKDPEYEAPESAAAKEAKKGQTSMTTGGTTSNAPPDSLPPIIHIPIAVTRGWEQRVQRASLPEGERPLPQAGLLFFEHKGKTQSIELIYNGPAGKASIPLQ